jgi:hypothetical protein
MQINSEKFLLDSKLTSYTFLSSKTEPEIDKQSYDLIGNFASSP